MASYSTQFKEAAVKKYLTRGSRSVDDIAREMGTTVFSIYHWSKQHRQLQSVSMSKSKSPTSAKRDFIKQLEIVADYFRLPEAERGEYLRKAGLTEAKIESWKAVFAATAEKKPHQIDPNEQKIKKLEKELRRKDRALAETAALLVLQKKIQEIWGSEDEL